MEDGSDGGAGVSSCLTLPELGDMVRFDNMKFIGNQTDACLLVRKVQRDLAGPGVSES